MKKYHEHQLASIFPMMSQEELEDLKSDIAKNGQLEPIWLYEGKILDGRNRYLACVELGIEPIIQEYKGSDPLSFVISKNLYRRHLNSYQRAKIVLQLKPQLSEEAKEKQIKDGKTGGALRQKSAQGPMRVRDELAKLAAVSHDTINKVEYIEKNATPEQKVKLEKGEASINKVYTKIKEKEIEEKNKELAKNKPAIPSDLYDVIVIDPPWPMKKILREVTPNQAGFDYPTMSIDEIKQLKIPAAENCHIFLWTTQKYLPTAIQIIEEWGYNYVLTMVWHKDGGFQPFGLPQYNCEFIVYAKKGNPTFIDTKQFPTCFSAKRTGHSQKPDYFYQLISRTTSGKRLNMFARTEREGFENWGNEVGRK